MPQTKKVASVSLLTVALAIAILFSVVGFLTYALVNPLVVTSTHKVFYLGAQFIELACFWWRFFFRFG